MSASGCWAKAAWGLCSHTTSVSESTTPSMSPPASSSETSLGFLAPIALKAVKFPLVSLRRFYLSPLIEFVSRAIRYLPDNHKKQLKHTDRQRWCLYFHPSQKDSLPRSPVSLVARFMAGLSCGNWSIAGGMRSYGTDGSDACSRYGMPLSSDSEATAASNAKTTNGTCSQCSRVYKSSELNNLAYSGPEANTNFFQA